MVRSSGLMELTWGRRSWGDIIRGSPRPRESMRPRLLLLTLLAIAMLSLAPHAVLARPAALACTTEFQFQALRNLIPDVVGDCLSEVIPVPAGGGLQITTGDLSIFVSDVDVVQITS